MVILYVAMPVWWRGHLLNVDSTRPFCNVLERSPCWRLKERLSSLCNDSIVRELLKERRLDDIDHFRITFEKQVVHELERSFYHRIITAALAQTPDDESGKPAE